MQLFSRIAVAACLLVWPLSYVAAQHLQCSPCKHDYGPVEIGASKRFIFKLTNTGKKTLQIRARLKSGPAFSSDNFPLPVTLRPGGSVHLPVIFQPIATGKNMGSITLGSDALNHKLVMSVWGYGTKAPVANLRMSPSHGNFGDVTVGSSVSLQLTLSASNGPVTISAAQVDSSEFKLRGCVLPKMIASGENMQITVVFRPKASGAASGELTLVSDADSSPNRMPLSGVGVAVGSHSVDLSWAPPHQSSVIGYNVYRSNRNGGPYQQINSVLDSSTNYSDRSVKAGAAYYYVVTAVDADNLESGYSNQVKGIIPSP
jgi:hypothetical protein